MRFRKLILSMAIGLFTVATLAVSAGPEDQPRKKGSLKEALELVKEPYSLLVSDNPSKPQAKVRLQNVVYHLGYEFKEEDAKAWKAVMSDAKASPYVRMSAAYFLLDTDEDARKFLKEAIESGNLKHRYNAALVLEMYIDDRPARAWAVDLAIAQIDKRTLEGSGVTSAPCGQGPDRDSTDILLTPVNDLCWKLGEIKSKKAVSALILDFERRGSSEAATALGKIGDPAATPALLKALRASKEFDMGGVTEALGKLKCKEAVPLLTERLGRPVSESPDLSSYYFAVSGILNALLDIGDKSAVPAIEGYLDREYPDNSKAVARRILVEIRDADPVPGLLLLLEKATDRDARYDLLMDLCRYKDVRAIDAFVKVAREDGNGYNRDMAFSGLEELGNRKALLALAALLDVSYPASLGGGEKGEEPFSVSLPKFIQSRLVRATHQDFGADSRKWAEWIEKNIKD